MEIQKFHELCLQGNVLKAIEYLKASDDRSDDIDQLLKQYEDRFITHLEVPEINSNDPWIKSILTSYYAYFRSVLMENNLEKAENDLILDLSKQVGLSQSSSLDEIEDELEKMFNDKGYSFLGGVSAPYRGPYIWKHTEKKVFKVTIPDGEQEVVVYFMSEFLLLSWAHYATMGKRHTGGWAKPEGLFYVDNGKEKIDTTSSEFQVWFLKHEAQHLSDYKKFPTLEGCGLEYRAKLVELIYNPKPHDLIQKFLNQSQNDESLPHSHAAYTIINHMSSAIFNQEYVKDNTQWQTIESSQISKSALALLNKNTQHLLEQ